MGNVSEYFSDYECWCKGNNCCGNSYPMDTHFMMEMDGFRMDCGCSLNPSSAFRCVRHNGSPQVGGAPNSYHTKAKAMDLPVPFSLTLWKFAMLADKRFRPGGVIIYAFPDGGGTNRLHVDTRDYVYRGGKINGHEVGWEEAYEAAKQMAERGVG